MGKNIKFSYLYRDAGNYKQWGYVVFSNGDGTLVEDLRARISQGAIDSDNFIADQVRLNNLFFYPEHPLNGDDHWLHEFDSLSESHDEPTDTLRRTALDFVMEFEVAAASDWRGFSRRKPGL